VTLEAADALHANFVSAMRRIARATPQTRAERLGPWFVVDTGHQFPLFNQAVAVDPIAEPSQAVFEVADWFGKRGSPFHFVLRDPGEGDLIQAALGMGCRPGEVLPAMILEPLPEPRAAAGLEIEVVLDEGGAEEYARIMEADGGEPEVARGIVRASFEEDGFTMLLGRVEGRAVACSTSVVTGRTAGVYNVNVAPEMRRRGYGEAITRAAIDAGREAGCTMAALQAGEMGYPLFARMGFRQIFEYRFLDSA
jgi:GNAT superfamily N-acetyltransferase